MMRFVSLFAVVSFWHSPVSAELPTHGTNLTFADIAPLHLPYNAHIKDNLAKLEKACASGDGGACHTLGTAMLEHRNAVEARALEYFDTACDFGHADGCFEQGRMVVQDDASQVVRIIPLCSDGCVSPAGSSKAEARTSASDPAIREP